MKEKESPPFFSRSPTFLRRLPPFECLDQGIHSGSILLFLGFKENTELGWKSATLIFFFSKELKLGPFKRCATAVPNSIDRRNST